MLSLKPTLWFVLCHWASSDAVLINWSSTKWNHEQQLPDETPSHHIPFSDMSFCPGPLSFSSTACLLLGYIFYFWGFIFFHLSVSSITVFNNVLVSSSLFPEWIPLENAFERKQLYTSPPLKLFGTFSSAVNHTTCIFKVSKHRHAGVKFMKNILLSCMVTVTFRNPDHIWKLVVTFGTSTGFRISVGNIATLARGKSMSLWALALICFLGRQIEADVDVGILSHTQKKRGKS